MNRRKTLKALLFLAASSPVYRYESIYAASYQRILGHMVGLILPNTADCPGGYEAKVHRFITEFVEACLAPADKKVILLGLDKLKRMGFETYKKQKQMAILVEMDAMAASNKNRFFRLIKALTVQGYFNSEIGVTKALRYNPIPGKYIGCVPYKPGELAWY